MVLLDCVQACSGKPQVSGRSLGVWGQGLPACECRGVAGPEGQLGQFLCCQFWGCRLGRKGSRSPWAGKLQKLSALEFDLLRITDSNLNLIKLHFMFSMAAMRNVNSCNLCGVITVKPCSQSIAAAALMLYDRPKLQS